MSVKSTERITRSQAESLYLDLYLKDRKVHDRIGAIARWMPDSELEDELEEMADRAAPDGESFRNFTIVPDDFKEEGQ